MDLVGSNIHLSSQQYKSAEAKKKDSSGAGSLFTNELRPYAKWAAISTVAAVGIASVAFILYQYAHSDANLDDHSVGVGDGSSNGSDEAASTLGQSNLNPYDKPRKEPVDCILNLLDGNYEGKCLNGKAHGQGTEILKDGQICKGEWENGEFSGQGKCTWPDGEYHDGGWKNSLKHGQGVARYADGTICNGEWQNDILISGEGYCT